MLQDGEVYHGWYSHKAKDLGGSSIYRNPAGQEVEVTAVAKDLAWADEYHWDDKRYVGPVTEHLRKVCHGIIGPPAFFPPADRIAYNMAFRTPPQATDTSDTPPPEKVVAVFPNEFVPTKGILTRYGRKLLEQGKAHYGGKDAAPV